MNTLILDFDGTLVGPSEFRKPLFFSALRSFGARESAIVSVDTRWGAPFPSLISQAVGPGHYDEFIEHYLTTMADFNVSLNPGAIGLLTLAHSAAIPVFIVTSSDSRLVEADLSRLGVSADIERVFGADGSDYHKPDPRVFTALGEELRSRYRCDLDSAVFVGDSLDDLAASTAVGRFHAVLTGSVTRDQFEAHGLSSDRIHDGLDGVARSLRFALFPDSVDGP